MSATRASRGGVTTSNNYKKYDGSGVDSTISEEGQMGWRACPRPALRAVATFNNYEKYDRNGVDSTISEAGPWLQ